TLDAQQAHEARHALPAHPDPVLLAQLDMDARRAVRAEALGVDLPDQLHQPGVLPRPPRGRALTPRQEAAPAHAHHAAQGPDAVLSLLRLDELVDRYRVFSSPEAKKAAAFRRISRSSRKTFTSRLRRFNSSLSELATEPLPAADFSTHCLRA